MGGGNGGDKGSVGGVAFGNGAQPSIVLEEDSKGEDLEGRMAGGGWVGAYG